MIDEIEKPSQHKNSLLKTNFIQASMIHSIIFAIED